MPYAVVTPDIQRRKAAYQRAYKERNRAALTEYKRKWKAAKVARVRRCAEFEEGGSGI